MPTRKEFFKSCFAMIMAGAGAISAFAGRGGEAKENEGKEEEKKMIAKCGIVCTECPAYIATRKNDDALRAETARKWSEMFRADIKAADINCDGCQSEGPRLFRHCNECEIRTCARDRNASTCAACPEYSCAKLDAFLGQVPEARAMLEELRKG